MTRMIAVHSMEDNETRHMTLEEAEKIVKKIYNDPIGGLVADAKTKKVIWKIGPEVEEILVMEPMFGGG